MTGRYARRYEQLAQQRAYLRRVAARGLPALLAPYAQTAAPRVPAQRRPRGFRANQTSPA